MASPGHRRPEYWAETAPDRPALEHGDIVTSYSQWNLRADQLADGLHQLAPARERACVMTRMRVEWFVADLALAKLGWEHVAVSWRAPVTEQCAAVTSCRAGVVITDHDDVVALSAGLSGQDVRVISLGGLAPGMVPFASLQADPRPPRRTSRSPRLLSYTSGTTGTPKLTRTGPPPRRRRRPAAPPARPAPGPPEGPPPQVLQTLPLYHGAAPGGSRFCHQEGGTCHLLDKFDPVEALRIIEGRRITHWTAVPTMLQRIRALGPEALASFDVSSIRMLAVGGAASPMSLKRWALAYFGECLYEGYGASEMGIAAVMDPSMHLAKPGSCGKLKRQASVRVLDPDGAELPAGADGELHIRTPVTVAAGPGGSPAGEISQDAFFRTGDIGHVDEDGFVYITGRARDIIIRGGVNISSSEIEDVLCDYPGVAGVAVIGIPDEDLGEQIAAFCEPAADAAIDPRELREFAAARLASFKRPVRLELVAELPRNALGKVVKDELRQPFWSGRDFRFGR